jgi:peptidoglycan hydrolase-like protein with peptidoglycan-binding domain
VTRRRTAALVIAGVVIVGAAGWFAGRFISSPAEEAARTAPPKPSAILASAQMRELTTDVVTRGTARYGSKQALSLTATNLKSGRKVVTRLPAPDARLGEGDVALTVSERPVFVLRGRQPSYRDLGPGLVGRDVRQLEAALKRLGMRPGAVDGRFDAATGAAVARMYSRAGFKPLMATEAQLAAIRPREADLVAGARIGPGVQVPADEVVFLRRPPVRVSERSVALGKPAAGPLMSVTDRTVSIEGSIRLAERQLVRKGMRVRIDEPALGIKAAGVVSDVADTPGTGGVDNFHLALSVRVDHAPRNLVGASVRLTIPVRSTEGPVLAVPLSALSLAADGSSQIERHDRGRTETVRVRPGLSANGYVQVTPLAGRLGNGDRVVVGVERRDSARVAGAPSNPSAPQAVSAAQAAQKGAAGGG